MHNTNTKIIPGMIDNSLEFFVVDNIVKAITAGKVIDFNDFPKPIISLLRNEMLKSPEVLNALEQMHPSDEIKQLEQFVKCRFGGIDMTADIVEGKIQDGEYWPCPNRGNCPHEGILCKLPMYNGKRLTDTEVKLIQLSSTEKTNEVIAEDMEMAMGTFHKQKKLLYEFFGVQTKQGITVIGTFLNII